MDRINSEKAYIAYQGTEEGSSESSVSGRPLPCKSKLDSVRKTLCGLLLTPRRCRFNHDEHGQLSMILAMLFGLATAFTVANLFYSYPILNILARDFQVSNERVSTIPTLSQAGYASGLLLICPLGDVVRRRSLILGLIFATATVWIALCLTQKFEVFAALCFITGFMGVTPQLMMPLVGEFAPSAKRAQYLSIVGSGVDLGVLMARLLSGVVTEYTPWRMVYWIALGLQYLVFLLLWLLMPDYPSGNNSEFSYYKTLFSIPQIVVRNRLLARCCVSIVLMEYSLLSYWTTLTFLLSGTPYHYSSLIIGLFALAGMSTMVLGPFCSKWIVDQHAPVFSTILGGLICFVGQIIGTYTGSFTVSGLIIQALLLGLGMRIADVANRVAIYSIDPEAKNKINTAYMLAMFVGQMAGTTGSSKLYGKGGWIASGSVGVGFTGLAIVMTALRVPWEKSQSSNNDCQSNSA